MATQYGFFFDAKRCIGCKTCVLACKDWNDDVPGNSVYWRRVTTTESGKFPHLRLINESLSCHHCGKPACVDVCPSKALSKRPQDGVVVVDRARCIGCGACGKACPYGAPQYGSDGKMQKCDLCLDRVQRGERAVCDQACLGGAIFAGPLDELARAWAKRSPLRAGGATRPSLLITVNFGKE